ncbi:MAG: putative Zn-dependent peptidase [Cyclobacteriaceae bacterium]|jgi:predicted Zn-dependent peptidase
MFAIGFATDPKNLKKSVSLVQKEINILKAKSLTEGQLQKAKTQLKGQLAMSEENNNAMMLMMAKSLLDLQTIPDLDHIFKKIDAVSASKLLELANECLTDDQFTTLKYQPIDS